VQSACPLSSLPIYPLRGMGRLDMLESWFDGNSVRVVRLLSKQRNQIICMGPRRWSGHVRASQKLTIAECRATKL
jgi:hypothetical protein